MAGSELKLVAAIDKELHDLCQPMMALSGVLELGQVMGDEASLRSAVDRGVVECRRMFESVARMRQRMAELSAEQKLSK